MLGPGIEMEMHNGRFPLRPVFPSPLASDFGLRTSDFIARGCPHKDRPRIACPAAVSGMVDKLNAAKFSPGAREKAASSLFIVVVVHQQTDALAGSNLADDFAIDPAYRLDLIRPVDWIVRPDQPGGF